VLFSTAVLLGSTVPLFDGTNNVEVHGTYGTAVLQVLKFAIWQCCLCVRKLGSMG